MDTLQHYLANTLKQQSTLRGWSLSHTAQVTGVSKAMLRQIEPRRVQPDNRHAVEKRHRV